MQGLLEAVGLVGGGASVDEGLPHVCHCFVETVSKATVEVELSVWGDAGGEDEREREEGRRKGSLQQVGCGVELVLICGVFWPNV